MDPTPEHHPSNLSRRQFLQLSPSILAVPVAAALAPQDLEPQSAEASPEQAQTILADALTSLKAKLTELWQGKDSPLPLTAAVAGVAAASTLETPTPPTRRRQLADFSLLEAPPRQARRQLADFSFLDRGDQPPSQARRDFLKKVAATLAASKAVRIGLPVAGGLATAAFFLSRAKSNPIQVEAAGDPLFLPTPSGQITISPQLETGLNQYFDASATPASPTPAKTPAPETPNVDTAPTATPEAPSPTPENPPQIVGDKNLLEYFFAAVPQFEALRQRRFERVKNDPAAAERIDSELLNSPRLNFIYLGIDNTTDRPHEHNDQGWGRSDIIMVISIDPRTFHTTAISIPRDLFAPELVNFHFDGNKINGITMADYAAIVNPEVKDSVPSTNWVDLTRIVIESATGLPIDFMIKTDIDFMDGYDREGSGGIFSTLFPQGLTLYTDKVHDGAYPAENYGMTEINFEPGEHTLNGWQLTAYARSRHESSDFSRASRQRQVLKATIKQLTESFALTTTSKTDFIDHIITALDSQQQKKTFFSDVDIIGILRTCNNHLKYLLSTPDGTLTFAAVITNTADEMMYIVETGEQTFTSFGLSRADVSESGQHAMLQNIEGTTTLTLIGSDPQSPPNGLGNFLAYWRPLRQQVKLLLI